MTQEDQPNCPDEDFEHFLKQQRLGPPVNRSGELLYQCGYVVGLAAAQQQTKATTSRWRLVGMAAAAVACVSLGLNVLSMSQMPSDESLARVDSAVDSQTTDTPSSHNDKRGWESFLAKQRPPVPEQAGGTLRASSWKLPLPDIQATNLSPLTVVPGTKHKILQPNDYHLLFQGEV